MDKEFSKPPPRGRRGPQAANPLENGPQVATDLHSPSLNHMVDHQAIYNILASDRIINLRLLSLSLR